MKMLRNNLAWNFIAIARLEVVDSSDLHVWISVVALSYLTKQILIPHNQPSGFRFHNFGHGIVIILVVHIILLFLFDDNISCMESANGNTVTLCMQDATFYSTGGFRGLFCPLSNYPLSLKPSSSHVVLNPSLRYVRFSY